MIGRPRSYAPAPTWPDTSATARRRFSRCPRGTSSTAPRSTPRSSSRAPSRFPYFAAIRQYWRYYAGSCAGTKRVYPFDARAHLILGLTGLGFTLDNTVKGGYENTVGVVSAVSGYSGGSPFSR